MAVANAYVIFKSAPAGTRNAQGFRVLYTKCGVYRGRNAHDALARFAADWGLGPIGDHAGGDAPYWRSGRKSLASFGRGQFHADITTIPATVNLAR